MKEQPIYERIRPTSWADFKGIHALKNLPISNDGTPLERNYILYGNPSSGKTSFAELMLEGKLSKQFGASIHGVGDFKKALQSLGSSLLQQQVPYVFIDEIHRWSKAQQDVLLEPIEKGRIRVILATTESPWYCINPALLSRCHLVEFPDPSIEGMEAILSFALASDSVLQNYSVSFWDTAEFLRLFQGDIRQMLLHTEQAVLSSEDAEVHITKDQVEQFTQQRVYDESMFYSLLSAYIKSMRSGNASGALYCLAHMLEQGSDILHIARRLIVFASEDIGLANANALLLAESTYTSCAKIGLPEASIILSQCTVYCSESKKSRKAYDSIQKYLSLAKNEGFPRDIPQQLESRPRRRSEEEEQRVQFKWKEIPKY